MAIHRERKEDKGEAPALRMLSKQVAGRRWARRAAAEGGGSHGWERGVKARAPAQEAAHEAHEAHAGPGNALRRMTRKQEFRLARTPPHEINLQVLQKRLTETYTQTSRGQKSKIKVSAALVPSGDSDKKIHSLPIFYLLMIFDILCIPPLVIA